MAELDFTQEDLLEQARGNQSAFWHLALRWAREREGSADGWAEFVGEQFASSWDELGNPASALEVARLAALNAATTADMRPVELSGDDSHAELLIEGPEDHWLSRFGTTRDESDHANELIFRAIARRRGLTLQMRRDEMGLRLVFARQ